MTSRYEAQQKISALEDSLSNPCSACTYHGDHEYPACEKTDGCAPVGEQLDRVLRLLREFAALVPDYETEICRLGAWDSVSITLHAEEPGPFSIRTADGQIALQGSFDSAGAIITPPIALMGEEATVWADGKIMVTGMTGRSCAPE